MADPNEQSDAALNFPTVGRWRVTALPGGWIFIAKFGIKQMLADPTLVAANVSLGEDTLSSPEGLPAYISAQGKLIQSHLLAPKIAGPQLMPFPGADEAYLYFVRHTPENTGNMIHVQQYVRSGTWVGIITLTTLEAQLHLVRPAYESFAKGLRIIRIAEPVLPN